MPGQYAVRGPDMSKPVSECLWHQQCLQDDQPLARLFLSSRLQRQPLRVSIQHERSRCDLTNDFVVDGVKRGLSSKSRVRHFANVSCLSQAACLVVMITLFLGRAIHVIFSILIFHFELLKNIPPHKNLTVSLSLVL